MSEEKYTYQEIAETFPSEHFGNEMSFSMLPAYTDKGAYLFVYAAYEVMSPNKILTIAGENPPEDIDEFNDWVCFLKYKEPSDHKRNAWLESQGRKPMEPISEESKKFLSEIGDKQRAAILEKRRTAIADTENPLSQG